jgi:regulatory subunit for Cdc7p protein kinase
MATVLLSPTPVLSPIMSTRRTPLSNNPNVANSPLRGHSALAAAASKQKRSYANIQREELYGQPPPLKKQVLENGIQRPSKLQQPLQRPGARTVVRERINQPQDEELRQWQKHYRARFPKMVFYFESIPDDARTKLAKQVMSLGAVSLLFILLFL